ELKGDPVRLNQTLGTIRNAGRHLLSVINDILDLSKIEAAKMTVETVETSVVRVLMEIESLVRPREAEKGGEFAVRVEGVIGGRWAGMVGGDVRLARTGAGAGSCLHLGLPLRGVVGAELITALPADGVQTMEQASRPMAVVKGGNLLAGDGADNQRLIALQ